MPSYIIAGASGTLGYQFLLTLSADPSNTIIALVRTPESLSTRLASDNISRSNIHILPFDITSADAIYASAASATTFLPNGADHLIINAAYVGVAEQTVLPSELGSLANASQLSSEAHKSFFTNFLGPVWTYSAYLPLIRLGAAKTISILTTGLADVDATIKIGLPTALNYSASKAAVNMLVAKSAGEVAAEGIKVIGISPGMVKNPQHTPEIEAYLISMFQKLDPEFKTAISKEASIDMMLKVIGGVTMEMSGQSWSHHGDKNWL